MNAWKLDDRVIDARCEFSNLNLTSDALKSISLDGFVGGPNGEVDWIFRTTAPDSTEWVVDTLRKAGTHVMGSRTYYDMAALWPYSDRPFAQQPHGTLQIPESGAAGPAVLAVKWDS